MRLYTRETTKILKYYNKLHHPHHVNSLDMVRSLMLTKCEFTGFLKITIGRDF